MSFYTRIIDLQKLGQAWSRVKKNNPAAGIDEITAEEFDAGLQENLKQLHLELKESRYDSLPVRITTIYRGEKRREISLFSMRDKVVQQSIAAELQKIYDGEMSESTYAYRTGRSALQAVELLSDQIRNEKFAWILKADIKDFFDSVILDKLYNFLRMRIREEDTMILIQQCCEAPALQRDGTLKKRTAGLYQGSGISPVLSNIYLMKFDVDMRNRCGTYVRYSDDILVLGYEKQELEETKRYMQAKLQMLGLFLSEAKTVIKSAEEGVEFLGYHLSRQGNTIPAKAEKNLAQKLEEIWLTSKEQLEVKLKKSAEILQGWEQYYRKERPIRSIQEYVTVVYMVRNKDSFVLEEIKEQRKKFRNVYREIGIYLAAVWKEQQDWKLALLEYEQIYEIPETEEETEGADWKGLCACFEALISQETEEKWSDLMQYYTDMGAYGKAAGIMERILQMKGSRRLTELPENNAEETKTVVWDSEMRQLYLGVFSGREDIYGREELGMGKKRRIEVMAEPLTEKTLQEHLEGKFTVSTYVQRPNHTVKCLVIDIDISKRVLLENQSEENFQRYLLSAANTAQEMLKILKRLGLKGYLEYSGYRGYHIWIFFEEWIPVRYVNMLTDILEAEQKTDQTEITLEFFPNKCHLKTGNPGQAIKLPLGIHVKTGKKSILLSEDFQEICPDRNYLQSIRQYPLSTLKRIIGTCTTAAEGKERKTVDTELDGFGELTESVRIVLEKCNLMRYLCQKARTTGYLTHFERLSVLYIFGHLGEEGKEFVHKVMEFTLNYQYHQTEKFIQKLPAKPVSCLKLREQYKQITAEYGCSCSFRRTQNCYPSPVLHALKSSEDVAEGITVPTSRSLSKEKEQRVLDEINIHKKVQELAGKIVEMKKQRRGVDKAIQKAENELERIFDQAAVDCLEIDMGLLVRRRKDKGYEWLIEI